VPDFETHGEGEKDDPDGWWRGQKDQPDRQAAQYPEPPNEGDAREPGHDLTGRKPRAMRLRCVARDSDHHRLAPPGPRASARGSRCPRTTHSPPAYAASCSSSLLASIGDSRSDIGIVRCDTRHARDGLAKSRLIERDIRMTRTADVEPRTGVRHVQSWRCHPILGVCPGRTISLPGRSWEGAARHVLDGGAASLAE